MTIDTQTNLRLVRSWRLLVQSSCKLRESSEQVKSGQRISRVLDDAAGEIGPDSVCASWRVHGETAANPEAAASCLEETCDALGSIERVLARLLRATPDAPDGFVSSFSQSVLEEELAVIGSSLQRIARAASPEMGSTDKTAKKNIFEIDLLSNSRRSVELDRRREKPADYRADASTVAAVVRETRSAGGMTAPPESSSENKRAGSWKAGWENVQAVESRRSDVEAAAEAVELSRLTIVPNKRDGGDDAE